MILFSGGVESAYLLDLQLQTGGCDILTVEHSFNCPSVCAERIARENIIQHIQGDRKNWPGMIREHYRVTGDFHQEEFSRSVQWKQLAPLIHYAMRHVDHSKHSSVQLGLCLSDSSATIHQSLIQYWASYWKTFGLMNDGEFAPLDLILMRSGKTTVFRELNRDLKPLVSYCSTPDLKRNKWIACGKCVCCNAHQAALTDNDQNNGRYAQTRKSLDDLEKFRNGAIAKAEHLIAKGKSDDAVDTGKVRDVNVLKSGLQ